MVPRWSLSFSWSLLFKNNLYIFKFTLYVHDGYDKDCDPEADMLERDTILYKYSYY